MGRHQRPFFAERVYLRDDVDLTPLLLALVAPVSPGNPIFEEVLAELERCRGNGRVVRKQLSALLKSWIKEFQAGLRPSEVRISGQSWRAILQPLQPPESDTHFLNVMFRNFYHQSTLAGHRIGRMDCADMSVLRLTAGRSGPAPFSRSWARADRHKRHEMRRITHLLDEET
jgi:hypothetical protein